MHPITEKGGKSRILVIDDNRDHADTLAILLRFGGYEVKAVYDGFSAIPVAEEFRPDCVLSDIGLPGLDGYAIAEKFREHDTLKDIPLIAISAMADEARAAQVGFDRLLIKPVPAKIVLELLSGLKTMAKRVEDAEQVIHQQGAVVTEVLAVVKEVRDDVKEIKGELKQEVSDLKNELEEVKGEMKEMKEELREVKEDCL